MVVAVFNSYAKFNVEFEYNTVKPKQSVFLGVLHFQKHRTNV